MIGLWVSRAMYDMVVAERDRLIIECDKRVAPDALALATKELEHLRAQNLQLIEHLSRIGRREVGLPEVPRVPRKKAEELPPEIYKYVNGLGNPSMRKFALDTLEKRHADGEDWAAIIADTVPPEPVPEQADSLQVRVRQLLTDNPDLIDMLLNDEEAEVGA